MEQLVISPLSVVEIETVFEIVSSATNATRPSVSKTPVDTALERANDFVMAHALIGFITMVTLAGLAWFFHSGALINTMIGIGIFVMLLGLMLQVIVVVSVIPLVLKMRKEPYSPFLQLVKASYIFDLQFVNRLALLDVNAVKYVLVHYRYQRDGYEKRSGALSGSIERIGIFPALGALAVLSAGLSKVTFAPDWIQMLPPLIMAFYFLNLAMFGMIQKMDKVIALLEYSIESRT